MAKKPVKIVVEHKSLQTKYPWHLWMDGCWWEIQQNVDFTKPTFNMLTHLAIAGRKKGLLVRAYRLPGNRIIRFQYYKQRGKRTELDHQKYKRAHGIPWLINGPRRVNLTDKKR